MDDYLKMKLFQKRINFFFYILIMFRILALFILITFTLDGIFYVNDINIDLTFLYSWSNEFSVYTVNFFGMVLAPFMIISIIFYLYYTRKHEEIKGKKWTFKRANLCLNRRNYFIVLGTIIEFSFVQFMLMSPPFQTEMPSMIIFYYPFLTISSLFIYILPFI